MTTGSNWLSTALQTKILKRSLKVSAVVGTLLMLINHGDVILSGSIDLTHIFKILLTYLVPFSVATYSSVESTLNR